MYTHPEIMRAVNQARLEDMRRRPRPIARTRYRRNRSSVRRIRPSVWWRTIRLRPSAAPSP